MCCVVVGGVLLMFVCVGLFNVFDVCLWLNCVLTDTLLFELL